MADARKTTRQRKPADAAGNAEGLALVGDWTKGALKCTLALACLLAALVALRGVVPPSLAQTVVWTRWTVVPAAERGKWCACTTAYAFTGVETTCGQPLNYTDALWWSATHGGTRPGR
jgi:hypothetical protein